MPYWAHYRSTSDLLATRISTQLDSWWPDPQAVAVDTFMQEKLIERGLFEPAMVLGDKMPAYRKFKRKKHKSHFCCHHRFPTLIQLSSVNFLICKKYHTLNVYMSALLSVLSLLDGSSVGKHPMVVKDTKGEFYLHLPKPKYTKSWSVDSVLLHIKGWGSSLSLKQLSSNCSCCWPSAPHYCLMHF